MSKKISLLFVLIFVLSFAAFAQESEYGEPTEQARTLRDKDFQDAMKSPLELEEFPYFKSLSYFPNKTVYRVEARYVRTPSEKKFEMPTSTGKSKTAIKYAEAFFTLNGREYKLGLYQLEKVAQMEKYKNYLFIPFRDLTAGKETYGVGRYIDAEIPSGDKIIIDFNRAYNPSCAYNKTKFNCPIPPAENFLKVRIEAGEKKFHHSAKKDLVEVETQSRFANFENNKVHYVDVGKGSTALIFIHGWTCSAEFWKDSYTAFKNMRVIAVDLPGHGMSDKPQVSYTMDYFARSIESVMKDAKITKAILVGHSMGTPVIRQFYRLYPEKTWGLVVVDGGLRPFAPKELVEKFFAPLKANYKEAAPKFIDGMLAPVKDENLKAKIKTAMLATPEYVAISAMEAMNDEKIWTNDKIKVPTLVIMAKSSARTNEYEQFVRSIVPNVDYQTWDDVSHFLMIEKPDEFNKTLAVFLVKNNFVN